MAGRRGGRGPVHGEARTRYLRDIRFPAEGAGRRKETDVFRAFADVLRQIGGAIATVVTLPFRALARLFGGASSTARGHRL